MLTLFQGSAASYGDWNCNVPPSTIEMWIQYIATLEPDMVLYTGIPHIDLNRRQGLDI